MQYSKNPKSFHAMSIKPINKNKSNVRRREEDKDKFLSQISLADTSDRLTDEYLDGHDGLKFEILNRTRFNENSDLSMTYLGRSSMVRDHKMVVEERFPYIRTGVYNRQTIRWY